VAGHIRGIRRRSVVVANRHERSIKPQVRDQMALSVILDVEEVTAETNCRAAAGGLATRTVVRHHWPHPPRDQALGPYWVRTAPGTPGPRWAQAVTVGE
jgi:hypothetical protein